MVEQIEREMESATDEDLAELEDRIRITESLLFDLRVKHDRLSAGRQPQLFVDVDAGMTEQARRREEAFDRLLTLDETEPPRDYME